MPSRPIAIARRLRKEATTPEQMLWQQLRGRRLEGWKFRRQVPIAGYVADFCCHDARLTIEVDGVHHQAQEELDRLRRDAIETGGYLEIRFSNADVSGRLDWVVEEIKRALDSARGIRPRPSHPRFDP